MDFDRWKKTNNLATFKLFLLREMSFEIHSKYSRLLSSGMDKTEELKALEKYLFELREREIKTLSIEDFQKRVLPPKRETRLRPEKLQKLLKESDLTRAESRWEVCLLEEAVYENLPLYQIDVLVKASEAGLFHDTLTRSLWPDGVFIFLRKVVGTPWTGSWVVAFQQRTPTDEISQKLPDHEKSQIQLLDFR